MLQGDILSPFLFIVAMEGFHVVLLRAQPADVFHGIFISEIEISHLFYVDDIVLLSSWDPENANHIIRILWCFYLALGLKISLHKSKLVGVELLTLRWRWFPVGWVVLNISFCLFI